MLKANKSKWFEKLFSIYNRNLIKRRFFSFNVIGLENLSNRNKEIPTIIYANHSSWWDGLVAFQIAQKVKADFYVMMEKKQLENLQLFRKLGAFSVIRENARSAVETINYSVELLNTKSNLMICLFPQGEILPNDRRPIKFYNGLARIIEKSGGCQLLCHSISYEFLGEYKPQIFVSISDLQTFTSDDKINSKQLTEELSIKMTENLDELKQLIVNNSFNGFQNII